MPDATRKLIKGVSIHAPARGATKIVRSLYHYYYVSIHAPARGATSGISGVRGCFSRFNPRAREGRDVRDPRIPTYDGVSIHAPARGATSFSKMSASPRWFQSTRPRGARRYTIIVMKATNGFNPRAREGRDQTARPTD